MRRLSGAAALPIVLFFTLTLVNAAPQSSKGAYGNAGAITADELSTYLHFIASDQLEGRNAPSRGYDTAALYVASHLREWGLKPLGSTSGTTGPSKGSMATHAHALTQGIDQRDVSLKCF